MRNLLYSFKSTLLTHTALKLIVVGFLLLSIPATFYLSQRTQTLKSRASECSQVCTPKTVCDEERVCDTNRVCDSHEVCDEHEVCDNNRVCDSHEVCDEEGNCHDEESCRTERINCHLEETNCRQEETDCRDEEVNCRNEQINCRQEESCQQVCTQPDLGEGIKPVEPVDPGEDIEDIISGIIEDIENVIPGQQPGEEDIVETDEPSPELEVIPELKCEEDDWEFAGCDNDSCGLEYWRCAITGELRPENSPEGGDCRDKNIHPVCSQDEQQELEDVDDGELKMDVEGGDLQVEGGLEEVVQDEQTEPPPTEVVQDEQTEPPPTEVIQPIVGTVAVNATTKIVKVDEAKYETVTQTYNCQAAISCHTNDDGNNTGQATKRWTNISSDYIGSNVGCPGEQIVDALGECPAGNPYSGVTFKDEIITDTRTFQRKPATYEQVTQCEDQQDPRVYDCSRGFLCTNLYVANTDTQCKFEFKEYSCESNTEQCGGQGVGWLAGTDNCSSSTTEESGGCVGEFRQVSLLKRGIDTSCQWEKYDFDLRPDSTCFEIAKEGTKFIPPELLSPGDRIGGFLYNQVVPTFAQVPNGVLSVWGKIEDAIEYTATGGLSYKGEATELLGSSAQTVKRLWDGFVTDSNTDKPDDTVPFQVKEKPTADEALQLALNSGDATAAIKTLGVDLNAADNQGENLAFGVCLNWVKSPYNPFTLPGAPNVCLSTEAFVPKDADQSLSAVVRSEQVRGLARDMSLDLSANPNTWDDAKSQLFFGKVATGDFNFAKSAIETVVGLPVTTIEDSLATDRICGKEYGAGCFVSMTNPGVLISATERDFEILNSGSKIFDPNFIPADPELVKRFAEELFSTSFNSQGQRSETEVKAEIIDNIPVWATKLGVSPEEMTQVARTFEVYGHYGASVRQNTTYGKQMEQMHSKVAMESAIGLATSAIDPSVASQLIVGAGKAIIVGKIVKPIFEGAVEIFGRNGVDTIVTNAERALVKNQLGEPLEAVEEQALRQIQKQERAYSLAERIKENPGVFDTPEARAQLLDDGKFTADEMTGILNSNLVTVGDVNPTFNVSGFASDAQWDRAVFEVASGLTDDTVPVATVIDNLANAGVVEGAVKVSDDLASLGSQDALIREGLEQAQDVGALLDDGLIQPVVIIPSEEAVNAIIESRKGVFQRAREALAGIGKRSEDRAPMENSGLSSPVLARELDEAGGNGEIIAAANLPVDEVIHTVDDLAESISDNQFLSNRLLGVDDHPVDDIVSEIPLTGIVLTPAPTTIVDSAQDVIDNAISRLDIVGRNVDEIATAELGASPVSVDGQLAKLERIKQALGEGELTPEVEEFWRSLVRDADGRYEHLLGKVNEKYYMGSQPEPDLTSAKVQTYIQANLATREAFIQGLEEGKLLGDPNSFKEWVIELHKLQAYKGKGGVMWVGNGNPVSSAHGLIVDTEVASLVRRFDDPYNEFLQHPEKFPNGYTLDLPDVPAGIRPIDQRLDNGNVRHFYPPINSYDEYFEVMQKKLIDLESLGNDAPIEEQLALIAEFHQYFANARMFEEVNHSLVMNTVNGLLEQRGLKPIEQGMMDFAAMRLSPDNFQKYFIEEVKRAQNITCGVALITVAYAADNPCRPVSLFDKARETLGSWADGIFGRENAPEAKEGLGLVVDSTGYSKFAAGSTTASRFGQTYPGGGVEEFEALSKLYQVAPDNVVKPTSLIKEGDEVVGYKMEFVEGTTVQDYIERNGGLPAEVKDQITSTLETFHQNNLAHGDPNFKNILITPEGKVKFIDPVAYKDFKNEYAQYDTERVRERLTDVKTIDLPTSFLDNIRDRVSGWFGVSSL